MFRINSIMNENRDKVNIYDVREDAYRNYYTILTGDNASGKSSLLSKAINFFLFSNKKDEYLEKAIDLVSPSDLKPSRIIALCNSRFDKFTSNIIFNTANNKNKYAESSMFYIHPEINDNSRKGVSSIVDQCLKNSLRNRKLNIISNAPYRINDAFDMFGLQSRLHLKFTINKRNIVYILVILDNLISGKMTLEHGGLTHIRNERHFIDKDLANRISSVDESIEFLWREKSSWFDPYELFDTLSMINEDKFTSDSLEDIYFSIAEGDIYSDRKSLFWDFSKIEIIECLLILNVLNVSEFQVMHLNSNKEVSILSLSSGQRTLFGHAIVLSSFVENSCMVCIDEPENSLHPEWQLNFMRFISLLCPETLKAHILIATHSPQIISGMQFDNGCVLSLIKRDNFNFITMRNENKHEESSFYELQPLKIYREQSSDKQLTGIFKSPGFKNDFIIRKLLLIISKLSKKAQPTEDDNKFIADIRSLIVKKRIPDEDPVQILFRQVISFLNLGNYDD